MLNLKTYHLTKSMPKLNSEKRARAIKLRPLSEAKWLPSQLELS
jgi:hypothetical protein